MKKSGHIVFRAICAIGMILAAAIIAVSCMLPLNLIKELNEQVAPLAQKALELVLEERNEEALDRISEIKAALDAKKSKLMMLFGHDRVAVLCCAAETAFELAMAGDKAQLITELTAIINECEFMLYANEPGIENLF